MQHQYKIPILGDRPTIAPEYAEDYETGESLIVTTYTPFPRFAVRVADDGLEGLGIREGDYLIFVHQRWPQTESQVCYLKFGDEAVIRILEGIFNQTVYLRTSGDRYPEIVREKEDFVVTGVMIGVVRADMANIVTANVEEHWEEW